MRYTWNSIINVTATGFPAHPSLTFSGMLATCVNGKWISFLVLQALFAVMSVDFLASGFGGS